jgi:hypothetical protein
MKRPTKTLRVVVTKADIKDCDPTKRICPISMSLERAFGYHVYVQETSFEVDGVVYLLPKTAVDFNAAFDAGKKVNPFCFYAKERVATSE